MVVEEGRPALRFALIVVTLQATQISDTVGSKISNPSWSSSP